MSSFDTKVAKTSVFLCENRKNSLGGWGCAPRSPVVPPSLYQNLGAPLITIAIFCFLQNERGVLPAKNAANCDPSKFSIALRY